MRSRCVPLTIVWERAFCDSDLGATTRLVAFAMKRHMGADGSTWVSAATVAESSGQCTRTVRDHRRILVDRGWLTIERPGRGGRGHTNLYRAAQPPGAAEAHRPDWEAALEAYPRRERVQLTTAKGAARSRNGASAAPDHLREVRKSAPSHGARSSVDYFDHATRWIKSAGHQLSPTDLGETLDKKYPQLETPDRDELYALGLRLAGEEQRAKPPTGQSG
jgi:hypothetical protein